MPTSSIGSSSSKSFSRPFMNASLSLDEAALQIALHQIAFVSRRQAGQRRRPFAVAADAAVLCLRQAHQRLFIGCVHAVDVVALTLADALTDGVLAHEVVAHHRRLAIGAEAALQRSRAEVRFVSGLG